VGKPILHWMEPTVRARADTLGALRRSWLARVFLLGWIPVLGVLVWMFASDAYLGVPFPVRLLAAVGMLHVLVGLLVSLSLLMPLGTVWLEPQRVSSFFGRSFEVFPLTDVADYRLTDCGRWRELALRLRNGSEKTYGVPLRIANADIRRYFDERGVARAEDTHG
jgi:hypothetical protein